MAYRTKKYLPLLTVLVLLMAASGAFAQQTLPPPGQNPPPAKPFTTPEEDTSNIPHPELGPYDTIPVPAKVYGGEWLPAHTEGWVWVTARMTAASRRKWEEWTRLRNAVMSPIPMHARPV